MLIAGMATAAWSKSLLTVKIAVRVIAAQARTAGPHRAPKPKIDSFRAKCLDLTDCIQLLILPQTGSV
jgi:hypothetical protein